MTTPRALLALFVLVAGCAHSAPAAPRTVDLQFRDAPILDVLHVLATSAQVNLDVDPDVTGTVSIDVHGAPWDVVLATIAKDHVLRVESAGPVIRVSRADSPPTKTTFIGAPIDVDFAEMPLRDAVSTIAGFAKISITVADGVDAKVTLRLRNAPWDLALDHIARAYGLRLVEAGGAYRIEKR